MCPVFCVPNNLLGMVLREIVTADKHFIFVLCRVNGRIRKIQSNSQISRREKIRLNLKHSGVRLEIALRHHFHQLTVHSERGGDYAAPQIQYLMQLANL